MYLYVHIISHAHACMCMEHKTSIIHVVHYYTPFILTTLFCGPLPTLTMYGQYIKLNHVTCFHDWQTEELDVCKREIKHREQELSALRSQNQRLMAESERLEEKVREL